MFTSLSTLLFTVCRNTIRPSIRLLTRRSHEICGVDAVLAFAAACYSVSDVSYSNPQTTASQWLIEFKPDAGKVHLTLTYRREREKGGFSHSSTGFGIAPDQLTGLTREQMMSSAGNVVRFQLKRDAGTFNFEGWFREGNGSGHFTFSPSSSFAADLSRQGFGRATDEQLQALAMNDVGHAYISELKAQGYDTATVEQLVRMGNHGVSLEFLQELKSLGYNVKTTDLIVRMKDHGVSVNFIRELAALGYSNLTPEELVRTKDHGVSARFINEFMAIGFERRSINEWIRVKDHGVNPAFAKEIKEMGFSNVSLDQLVRLKDHGVSATYIRRMKEKGFGDLTLEEYVRLKDRGERDE